MTKEVRNQSTEPQHRFVLSETSWDQVHEAGAYVERGSGDLYRIPQEALMQGSSSPMITKDSRGGSRLVQISRDPFITTLEARLRCAQHNIEPNF